MSQFVLANNISTQLAAPAANTTTSITIASAVGLPLLLPNQVMPMTLTDAATKQIHECVYVTAINGVTLTVLRAQEGTGAYTWNTGDLILCGPTAQSLAVASGNSDNLFQVASPPVNDSSANAAPTSWIMNAIRSKVILTDTGTANAYAATNPVPLTVLPATSGVIQSVQIASTNTGASTYSPDGLTPAPIFGMGGDALQGDELVAGGIATLMSFVSPRLNSGNLCWVLRDCTAGASQLAAKSYGDTAPQFDSTTNLATTGFVSRAVQGLIQRIKQKSGTYTITPADAGTMFSDSGSSVTYTLPDASTCAWCAFGFTNVYGDTLTINMGSSSQNIVSENFKQTSLTLTKANTHVILFSDSANFIVMDASTSIVSPRGITRFTSSTTWTVPANVTTVYLSGCAGGGGGGAGSATGGTVSLVGGGGGGGGGAGQSVLCTPYPVVPGSVVTVSIGAGGAGGAAGATTAATGGLGGNTVISGAGFNSGTSLTLAGGGGGGGGSWPSIDALGSGGAGAQPGSGYPAGSYGSDSALAGNGGAGASCAFGGGGGGGRAAMGGTIGGKTAGGFGAGGGGGGGAYGGSAAAGGSGGTGAGGVVIFEW